MPAASAFLWPAVTVAVYLANRALYRRRRVWWLSPILASPLGVGVLVAAAGTSYGGYMVGSRWLVEMLGPVTVAFALPIYRHRELIQRNARNLAAGVVIGCASAFVSSGLLAVAAGLSKTMALSLLPRSLSTPFAMAVSRAIGGEPELTAVFTAMTGVSGVALADAVLGRLRLQSSFARGALLGMGAHGAGVARAQQLGAEEASSAGLVMVLAGVANVLAAPWTAAALRFWPAQ